MRQWIGVHLFIALCLVALVADAQIICGALHTRCNGSYGQFVFYPCCVNGTYCSGPNGSCQNNPGYVPPVNAPPYESVPDGCGARGTRCNGWDPLGNLFYPCCGDKSLCTGDNGSCQYNALRVGQPAPPLWTVPPNYGGRVTSAPPIAAPSNGTDSLGALLALVALVVSLTLFL
jgi:hypothetical protein